MWMEILCNIWNKFGNGGNSSGNRPWINQMEELTDSITFVHSFECVFKSFKVHLNKNCDDFIQSKISLAVGHFDGNSGNSSLWYLFLV